MEPLEWKVLRPRQVRYQAALRPDSLKNLDFTVLSIWPQNLAEHCEGQRFLSSGRPESRCAREQPPERRSRAQHGLELLEFLPLTHRNENVTVLEPNVGLRIELHRAVLPAHCQHDDAVGPPELGLVQ